MIHESDKEQIEQLKRFWREYGRLLLVAIVVGLAAGYGWQYWQKIKHERNERAAMLFQQYSLLQTLNTDEAQQEKVLNELAQSYKESAYASFAKMAQAVNLIQQQHYDEALDSLQWVRKNAPSEQLRELATVREARLLLALHRAKESLDLLLGLQDSIYQPMAYELAGDAYAALGDSKKAQDSYQKAQAAYASSDANNVVITEKANSPIFVPKKDKQ